MRLRLRNRVAAALALIAVMAAGAALLAVMTVVVPRAIVVIDHPTLATVHLSPAGHGGTAGFAKLAPFAQHAGFDLSGVGNEFGTKPHRIRRAGLTGLIAALGAGTVDAADN